MNDCSCGIFTFCTAPARMPFAHYFLSLKSAFAHFFGFMLRASKKVRARINLHIQHPSAGNRHFLAHPLTFDTFILAFFHGGEAIRKQLT